MFPARLAASAALALSLAACATAPGPVEVTRFSAPDAAARLGQGPVFVAAAPGDFDGLALAPYKAAVAAELTRLGYRESDRATARTLAEVALEPYEIGRDGRRGPVSVGVGGSTGSYGSGVGLGIGINLGGDNGERVGRTLRLRLRDEATAQVLWEGSADLRVPPKSALAQNPANAQALASALLSDFPGTSGETIQVKVP